MQLPTPGAFELDSRKRPVWLFEGGFGPHPTLQQKHKVFRTSAACCFPVPQPVFVVLQAHANRVRHGSSGVEEHTANSELEVLSFA